MNMPHRIAIAVAATALVATPAIPTETPVGQYTQLTATAVIGAILFLLVTKVGPKISADHNRTIKEVTAIHDKSLSSLGEKMEACEERRDKQTDRLCSSIEKGHDRFVDALTKSQNTS